MREKERNLSEGNIKRVRKLRSEMSTSEKVLWEWLSNKQLGHKFRRQHPIGKYVIDFYCPTLKLCVEVDGEQHKFSIEADKVRDAFLLSKGIITIRIPSLQLFGEEDMNSEEWAAKLRGLCDQRAIELAQKKASKDKK